MKTHPTTRRRGAAAIEALEPRQYLALYLNDIDSLNLGKGMFAWTLSTSMVNDGFSTSNYSGWFSYLKNTMHLNYVITKAADGSSVLSQYTSTVVNAAHAAGLKIIPYFYLYGSHKDSVAAEAAAFNTVFNAGGVGGDAAIFDIESQYGDTAADIQNLVNYFTATQASNGFTGIGRSGADYGTGGGTRDKLFMAYSSYDIAHFHNTQLPFPTISNYTDAAMPQMYWEAHGYTQAFDIATTDADYRNASIVGEIKPVIPTGQSYDSSSAGDGSGLPSGSAINSYFTQVKADTAAVGPNNQSGFRYKSINYFDEHSLDRNGNGAVNNVGERSEIASEVIGDLPGTATLSTPANNATVASTTVSLDWSDVVNTFGASSVGAALYYDVYVDGALKTTISYAAPTAPVSAASVTVTGGTHTWYVIARDMFGSGTKSSTFTFTAGASLPGSFTNVSPANGSVQNYRPVVFDWTDSAGATSYDIYNGATLLAAGLTSSTWTGPLVSLNMVYSWHVVANNAGGGTSGPTWTVTVDSTPPTATLSAQTPLTGATFFNFNVTYGDPTSGVNVSTLDSSDITVSGPNGFAAAAAFISVDNNANGTPRVATYRIPAPGGFWTDADDGTYTVTQVAGEASDVAANFRAAGTIGTINIASLGTAWMNGSVLNVAFDPSGTPILLSSNGGNIEVSKNSAATDFAGVTSISVIGSSSDDRLQINAPVAPPLTFVDSAGNDLVEIDSGTSTFTADIGTPSRNLAVYVASGANVLFNSSQHLRSLSVDGTVTVTDNGSNVLWLTNLAVTGKLNLGDNDLIWDYSDTSPIGAWATTAYTGLTGLITAGRNGGSWIGNGLLTDQSAAWGGSPLTTLGIAEASDVLNYQSGQTALFAGQSVDSTAVLVKYTYTGDANLSGHIDGDDFFRIDSAYGNGTPTFARGDFDLNGRIDADDYFLLDSNYVGQGVFL